MHTPPAVTYPVGRSVFAACLAAALLALGVAVLAAWTWQSDAAGWRHGLAAAVLLLGAGLAWRAWRAAPRGELRWDGAGWTWRSAAGEEGGRLECVLDLQQRMLARWQPAGGRAAWFWLERNGAPHDWAALRRAVYSPARTEAPRGAKPPWAEP